MNSVNLTKEAVKYYKADPEMVAVQLSGIGGWKSLEDAIRTTAWGNCGHRSFPGCFTGNPFIHKSIK